jgi:TonB-linked SusC/RagA family outer membrane protein
MNQNAYGNAFLQKRHVWAQTLLYMKLTALLLFVACLHVSARTYSQKVSLSGKNISLEQVFEMVKAQTGYDAIYNPDLLKKAKRITIDVKNADLTEALQYCFRDQPVSFLIRYNTIVVTTRLKEKEVLTRDAEYSEQDIPVLEINGKVLSESGEPLPGVSVAVKGTAKGTTTKEDGSFIIDANPGDVLVVSLVGHVPQEITVRQNASLTIKLEQAVDELEQVVVVGYGMQKKSDITGAVASLPKERLEKVLNTNIAQAIQGSIPGVMVMTSSAGAVPDEAITIRGRNSITASNTPLIVVDGIPYGGQISDINPNDIQRIEVLKDASAAAIYGSRGSNGIILITTKEGVVGKNTISYQGKYSVQRFAKLPDLLTGQEFYSFKMQRDPAQMTPSEQEIYDSGKWVDWVDLAMRQGFTHDHNLSVSGGFKDTKYYISGGLLDVTGLALNDNFQRITSRINVETKIANLFSIGTRTQISLDDASGASPSFRQGEVGPFNMNPLTSAYDEYGNLTVFPWPRIIDGNPLQGILYDDLDKSNQILSNNYLIVNIPFIKGLSYRNNTALRLSFVDKGTYMGRDTQEGYEVRGKAKTERSNSRNIVIENILSYSKDFGVHNIFATGLYSFERNISSTNGLSAQGFPNDFLSWYSSAQAELIEPGYDYSETNLISQMLRLNYTYDKRYLLTMTVRRDGYSGFGTNKKWGSFPSVAVGWNLANESYFPLRDIFNELKIRASLGSNGNQSVKAYQTLSRLTSRNMVSGSTSLPGYRPSVLGQDELGWETSRVLNLGLDFGILKNRIGGNVNWYLTNTTDLLLARTISAVHGITSIVQNIGETQNNGLEISVNSRNIVAGNFQWSTTANLSWNKNKITSLYGLLDKDGKEIDDIANRWFIGKPITVNYDFVWNGVWQENEAEEASKWGSKPGYVKLLDVNGDLKLSGEDRQIIGQRDPKFLWGLSNTFSYKNISLTIFIHGVHGITKYNPYMRDDVLKEIRRNTVKKNWWTPENPTNDFYMNQYEAQFMAGVTGNIYENASFIRFKDISLSYDLPQKLLGKMGINKLGLFMTGRNLYTITKWSGLDPELSDQMSYPLQKEFVFGLNLGL